MATITATVTEAVTRTVSACATTTSSANRATPQGGIFEGLNPTHYNTKDPITLFIIQATLVIAMTRLLHWPLSKLRQPRVIAEVITGILLGPTVMGRIPGFSDHIFPPASMPAFSLAANIGLVLFLFLVGLEVDLRFLVSNWRIALSVGAAGMALPFGLGVGIAYGLYHEFREDSGIKPISFGIYALFIGVALAITAFPVLCRILSSLKLLSTPVGVIVLSAGIGNDVVGWILLALCVALVNSGAGLTALWIFLVAVGYSLALTYAVRPVLMRILRKTRSLDNGPTQGVVALVLLMVLASSFFTGIIGIHAIFGAFMVGLICPHEGGFAIKLTEKIEDLISTLFLPLYFALSGLNTNLGLLNTGISWAYVIGVTAIAFIGKIAGGTIASRLNGLVWRESFTIGCLMSCKGLVELIVLNIGLQANILSTRTFSIFVVMALVTTFATTPLTSWLYPPWYQQKLELWKKGKIDWDGNPIAQVDGSKDTDSEQNTYIANRLLVYLRTDALSSLFSVIGLFTGGQSVRKRNAIPARNSEKGSTTVGALSDQDNGFSYITDRPLRIDGLRLMELTERNSSVMKVSEIEDYAKRDPIIKAFGSSAHDTVRDVTISGQISVVPENSFAGTLVQTAADYRSDFILLPWSETGSISEIQSLFDTTSSSATQDPLSNKEFARFVSEIYDKAYSVCGVGVFVDKSLLKRGSSNANGAGSEGPAMERPTRTLSRIQTGLSLPDTYEHPRVVFRSSDGQSRQQIRVLCRSDQDGLYAARIALQLAATAAIDVRIVRMTLPSQVGSNKSGASTPSDNDMNFAHLKTNVPEAARNRVTFVDVEAPSETDPKVADALLHNELEPNDNMVVIIGRGANSPSSSHELSMKASSNDRYRPLGETATHLVGIIKKESLDASVLVVQAKAFIQGDRPRKGSASSSRAG